MIELKKQTNQHTQYMAVIRAIQQLQEDGHITFRVYQNRKLINIIATKDQIIRLIKIRTTIKNETKITPAEELAMKAFSIPNNAHIEIWVWQIGKGWNQQIIK